MEAIVGGITGAIENPRALLLGRIDGRGRRLRYVARTVPLALSQRQEIGRMLTAATGVHPWPQPLPAAWIGQLERREPQPYVQVDHSKRPPGTSPGGRTGLALRRAQPATAPRRSGPVSAR